MLPKENDDSQLTFSSTEFDTEQYYNVARKARLREIAQTNSRYDAAVFELRIALTDNERVNPSFIGKPEQSNFDAEEGLVFGSYRWAATIKVGRKSLISAKTDYLLVYDNLEDADPRYVRLYFEKLARFTSFPYFRSFFSLATANSGLALPPLPSLTERVD